MLPTNSNNKKKVSIETKSFNFLAHKKKKKKQEKRGRKKQMFGP